LVTGVAVEKLARHEFAEIASRQEALQTIFPGLLDIFYVLIFGFIQKTRVFQQALLFSTVILEECPRD
jgi:mannose/fructose/N-acetylgalactosamine-specific phosphotransferase system component IID